MDRNEMKKWWKRGRRPKLEPSAFWRHLCARFCWLCFLAVSDALGVSPQKHRDQPEITREISYLSYTLSYLWYGCALIFLCFFVSFAAPCVAQNEDLYAIWKLSKLSVVRSLHERSHLCGSVSAQCLLLIGLGMETFLTCRCSSCAAWYVEPPLCIC